MTMRRKKEKEQEAAQSRKQREVIRDVMLSAGQCGTWLTLDELTKLTSYPPASISAQLRHLRKPRFGSFAVVKRCRATDKAMRGDGFGAVWEYSVQLDKYGAVRRVRRRRGKTQNTLQMASC